MARKRNTAAVQTTGPAPNGATAAQTPGPLVMTLAVERATSRLSLASNAADERDLALLDEALRFTLMQIQLQRLAAAEARGAAGAARPAADPAVKPAAPAMPPVDSDSRAARR